MQCQLKGTVCSLLGASLSLVFQAVFQFSFQNKTTGTKERLFYLFWKIFRRVEAK